MSAARTDFDYRRYLASREWSLLREQVRERSGNECEHCLSAPQQAVHHLTYERLGHENLEDLMAVCRPCHEWFSGKSDVNPLDEWAVVSTAIDGPDPSPFHFIIPQVLPDKCVYWRVARRTCTGAQCIWCEESFSDWPWAVADLARFDYRTVDEYIDKERLEKGLR